MLPVSCVDDIVLGYVVEVLSSLGQEEDECSFDVEEFVEMMAAYIPEFATVDRSLLLSHTLLACWMNVFSCLHTVQLFVSGCSSKQHPSPPSRKILTIATQCSIQSLQY